MRLARTINRLTAGHVAKLSAPGTYVDGNGLILRIAPGGSKQWQFRYRWGDRERYMGLGGVRSLSLSKAREAARKARELLLEGRDPIEERRAAKRAALAERLKTVTFREACRLYLKAHQSGWRNEKHREQWSRTLEMYAWPFIGDLSVRDIDTAAVHKVLEPVWTTKNETASRLRQRIEKVLDWATVHGYREGENPARWRGHLQALLPAPSKVQKTQHLPALPYQKVGDFLRSLRDRDGIAARALEFTILTVARSSEATGARWEEVDFDAGTWTVPAERMKAGREHVVPLSERAVEILRSMEAVSNGNGFVFPGQRKATLSNMAMLQLLKRMEWQSITVHGFRSTFRDWAGDCTAYPREVAEACLAHTIQGVEAAYRRSDALEKRRRLLDDWAEFCRCPTTQQVFEGDRSADA